VVIVSKKAVVKRITSEEDALIEVLRTHGMPNVLQCLNTAINSLPPESSDFLRSARTALKPNLFLSLQHLVDLKAITLDDANLLLLAISENRNIAIVGENGSGKTTLLHASICEIEDYKRVVVCEPVQEMDFVVSSPDKHILAVQSTSLMSTDMLDLVLKPTVDRVVFGEVLRSGEVSALLFATVCGQSVMFSAKIGKDESVLDFLQETLGATKPNLSTSLKDLNLVVVRCSKSEDDVRTFAVEA
jgi:type IV secretory pathway ATPase VirB11/archaellum biosynthesis ATPase